jgi:hypothetical protein
LPTSSSRRDPASAIPIKEKELVDQIVGVCQAVISPEFLLTYIQGQIPYIRGDYDAPDDWARRMMVTVGTLKDVVQIKAYPGNRDERISSLVTQLMAQSVALLRSVHFGPAPR